MSITDSDFDNIFEKLNDIKSKFKEDAVSIEITNIKNDISEIKESINTNVKNIETNTSDISEIKNTVDGLSNYDDSAITAEVETLNSDVAKLKKKTQYILSDGDAIQTDGLLNLIGKIEVIAGITDQEDQSLYRNWGNILAGIRFTEDGIEMKSGGGSILINGEGVNITSGDNGINIGGSGTKFVGSSPYIGDVDELEVDGLNFDAVAGEAKVIGEDE